MLACSIACSRARYAGLPDHHQPNPEWLQLLYRYNKKAVALRITYCNSGLHCCLFGGLNPRI